MAIDDEQSTGGPHGIGSNPLGGLPPAGARPARRGAGGQPQTPGSEEPTAVLNSTSPFEFDETAVQEVTSPLSGAATGPLAAGAAGGAGGGGNGGAGSGTGAGAGKPGMPKNQKILIGVIIGVVVLAVIIGLVAFLTRKKPAPVAVDTPTPSASATPTPTPTPQVAPVWPLTGVSAADAAAVANRPAVAVKIENAAEARPQLGLEDADVVYEEMVEGGIARFIAVYQSKYPTQVYPVRSIRPMDGPIVAPLKGIIAFSGGQAPFISTASADGLQLIYKDHGDSGFGKVSGKKAPHNVSGNVELWAGMADADHKASPVALADFATADQKATVGSSATKLSVEISSVAKPSWTWDAASGKWLRYEKNAAAMDAAGSQLSATNVIALSMPVHNTQYMDAAHNYVPETEVVGSGDGIVMTDGTAIKVTWSKASDADQIKLTTADGSPVVLNPGNTWFELVPSGSGSYTVS
jgi:hypothetical protein